MQKNPSGLSEITFLTAWPHFECFVSVAVLVAVKPFREKRLHPAENRCLFGSVKSWKFLNRKHARKQWQTK
jgi:hypothetical protein